MQERRERRSYAVLVREVELRSRETLSLGALRDDLAPRVDDDRLAVRLPPAGVLAVLPRCHHVYLVFDRARSQERMPVVLAGREREGRRHREDARALVDQQSIELREANVVADAEAHPYAEHLGRH